MEVQSSSHVDKWRLSKAARPSRQEREQSHQLMTTTTRREMVFLNWLHSSCYAETQCMKRWNRGSLGCVHHQITAEWHWSDDYSVMSSMLALEVLNPFWTCMLPLLKSPLYLSKPSSYYDFSSRTSKPDIWPPKFSKLNHFDVPPSPGLVWFTR